jgi:hypothetical protein
MLTHDFYKISEAIRGNLGKRLAGSRPIWEYFFREIDLLEGGRMGRNEAG